MLAFFIMLNKCVHYLLALGCLHATVTAKLEATINGLSSSYAFYDVNQPLNGFCRSVTDSNPPQPDLFQETIRGAKSGLVCSTSAQLFDIDSLSAVTAEKDSGLSFTIESPEFVTYSIWCVADGNNICRGVVMYNLNITESEEELVCTLEFAKDEEANAISKYPNKVAWLLNGDSLERFKKLEENDFSEVEGRIVVNHTLPGARAPGKYDCQFMFNISEQVFQIQDTYIEQGAPTNGLITFTPSKEQYTDEENVTLTCSFTGYPSPTIVWLHEGKIKDLNATVTTGGRFTNSTVVIEGLEDSTDRGFYSCKATNDHGMASVTAELHVRDKLAALWPFIGILVQVIALAICIAVGEKLRKKKYAEKQRRRQHEDGSTAART